MCVTVASRSDDSRLASACACLNPASVSVSPRYSGSVKREACVLEGAFGEYSRIEFAPTCVSDDEDSHFVEVRSLMLWCALYCMLLFAAES